MAGDGWRGGNAGSLRSTKRLAAGRRDPQQGDAAFPLGFWRASDRKMRAWTVPFPRCRVGIAKPRRVLTPCLPGESGAEGHLS